MSLKGNFSATLDGKPQGVYTGSTSDKYQAVLYGIGDLENGKHSVVLTNMPLSEAHQYLDIDFVRTCPTLYLKAGLL